MRDVCAVAIGITKYGKHDLAARELMTAAADQAIDGAGIDPRDIDGAFFGNAFGMAEKQGHLGPLIMSALGIPETPATVMETACASAGTAFHHAYRDVAGGFSDVVLTGGVEKVSMLDTLTATTYFSYGSDYTFEGGNGCSFLCACRCTAKARDGGDHTGGDHSGGAKRGERSVEQQHACP